MCRKCVNGLREHEHRYDTRARAQPCCVKMVNNILCRCRSMRACSSGSGGGNHWHPTSVRASHRCFVVVAFVTPRCGRWTLSPPPARLCVAPFSIDCWHGQGCQLGSGQKVVLGDCRAEFRSVLWSSTHCECCRDLLLCVTHASGFFFYGERIRSPEVQILLVLQSWAILIYPINWQYYQTDGQHGQIAHKPFSDFLSLIY